MGLVPFVSMGFATLAFPDDFLNSRGFAFARNSGVFRVGEDAVVDASSAIPVSGSREASAWDIAIAKALVFTLFRIRIYVVDPEFCITSFRGFRAWGQEGKSRALLATCPSSAEVF